MGGLHLGHGQLIAAAKKSEDKSPPIVLVSIFINPLQFNNEEDYEKYPRNLLDDCNVAEKSGADAVWAPSFNDVFPGGEEAHFKINAPEKLQKSLCGAKRKGHFNGVATVIVRLLNLVKPSILFLGEKDWQQYIIIRQLIQDFNLPIKLKGISTFRDKNGLAFSSRNKHLNQVERVSAEALPKILEEAARIYKKKKLLNIKEIKSSLERKSLQVEYVEAVDKTSLNPIINSKSIFLLAAAVKCGKTRLIDHTFLMMRAPIVAIDGPAGAGKSTVTQAFAKSLGLIYLDTGAMYRAVTWLLQSRNIDLKNEKEIEKVLETVDLELKLDKSGMQTIIINKQDITDFIRSPKVTESVSIVAAHGCVRKKLTNQQKKFGKSGGLVAEGRDIGTAVFPDAELKIFLTASTQERARRRSLDLKKKGFTVPSLIELEKQIKTRDELDSNRDIAPLRKSNDAKEVITDGMNIDEVVETLIELFRIEIPQEVWSSN